jgi:hypothetical protein
MSATSMPGQTTGPAATPRRESPSLRAAATVFWRRPTPWILCGATALAASARIVVGGWTTTDLLVVVALVLGFPVMEWVVHVVLLHWRPREVGGITLDPLVSRKHRSHHADPTNLDDVFIPLRTLVKAIAATLVVGLVVFPRIEFGLTYIAVQAALGAVYEWTHYLTHTDYRPRSWAYRQIWRNHRLHHYKNERYWFTVTSAGTADRLFRTYPRPADVPTSPTARSLHSEQ